MTNKEIAKAFQLLGDIMELHEENPFKIRSYQNAYMTLRKLDLPLVDMDDGAIEAIKGVGAAIAAKIRELLTSGKMETLEKYKAMTPQGIQEMLQVKGLGPKKVRAVWKGLGVETIGELLYAINENRLIELKGFGAKTQEEIRKQLEYYQTSRGFFLYASLEADAELFLANFRERFPGSRVEFTGDFRRKAITLEALQILVGLQEFSPGKIEGLLIDILEQPTGTWTGTTPSGLPVKLHICLPERFEAEQFRLSTAPSFMAAFREKYPQVDVDDIQEETSVFAQAGLPYLVPELREEPWALELADSGLLSELIEERDICGAIHAHSTWSDGLHSLREMAEECRKRGLSYLVISDHSKSAFYANGLSEVRVQEQFAEIDALNRELAPFRIFKGIEFDILNDGSLDYAEGILSGFECVIASIHSNLKMDREKATARLLRAVENPFTHVLGHPTGRLLLSRPGYPIDQQRIIDACVANGVAIELNANPYRLDLDWRWLPYAIRKGAMVSINPDAHSLAGLGDIRYGVFAARKGALDKTRCLNALPARDFESWLVKKSGNARQ